MVRYSQDWAEGLHRFGDFDSIVEALDAVDGIKFYGKGSNIDAALEEVNTFCFDRDNGWRGTEKYNKGQDLKFQPLYV